MFEERAEQLRADLRERVRDDRPYVLVNMVATIDGRAAIDGVSGPIGGDADQAWFFALRTCVDAVMVATGTLRTERYGRLVRAAERRAVRVDAGLAPDPLAVVVTRSGDVPWDAPMFADPDQEVLVYGPAVIKGSDTFMTEVIKVSDPLMTLADLRRRGVTSVLCEGGPTLNGALLAAGLVDELFVTVGPLVSGGEAPRIVEGDLPAPRRARLVWALTEGDEVLLRYAFDQ